MSEALPLNDVRQADALDFCRSLPSACVDLALTSPPYFRLRDYGAPGQIGLELSVDDYLTRLLAVTQEIRRVLKPGGALFLNIGDTYSSSRCRPKRRTRCRTGAPRPRPIAPVPAKSLMGVPWRLALKMIDAQGWLLRNAVIWSKPNPKPNSVRDRFQNAYEHVFFFTSSTAYGFDMDAVREAYNPQTLKRLERAAKGKAPKASKKDPSGFAEDPNAILHNMTEKWKRGALKGKIPLDVWTTTASKFSGAHFATFPEQLCIKPILACCPPGGVVLDPFMGSGTTAVAAKRLGRDFIGCDLNPEYVSLSMSRVQKIGLESTARFCYR